jgi:hypothetical protein
LLHVRVESNEQISRADLMLVFWLLKSFNGWKHEPVGYARGEGLALDDLASRHPAQHVVG